MGVVREPARIDLHGWAAELEFERVLAGSPPGAGEQGARLRIAWEELSEGRPTRFADDDRVLVILEDLPTYSLWRQRFPKNDALAVASRGGAFLHDPASEGVESLARYLALSPAERVEPAGIAELAAMAARADERLAGDALDALAAVPNLPLRLGESARVDLSLTCRDPGRSESTRNAAISLIGDAGILELRPQILELSASKSAHEAAAWTALAKLDGGLPKEKILGLLARQEPALRVVGIEQARGSGAEARVAKLVKQDPNPEVRGRAVELWAAWQGLAGWSELEPALFDESGPVRGRAARAIGALGAAAVPRLSALLEGRTVQQAIGPIAALSFAGPDGRTALEKVMRTHPDERVRKLAGLALGRPLPEH